jgi:hypothetical protein
MNEQSRLMGVVRESSGVRVGGGGGRLGLGGGGRMCREVGGVAPKAQAAAREVGNAAKRSDDERRGTEVESGTCRKQGRGALGSANGLQIRKQQCVCISNGANKNTK